MNQEPNSTDDPMIEALRRLQVPAPNGVKAALLFRCGEAAAEVKFRRRQTNHRWVSAAIVFVALAVGGIAGRFSIENSATHRLAHSEKTEARPADHQTPPDIGAFVRDDQARVIIGPGHMLTAMMDADQVDAAILKEPTSVATSPSAPAREDRVLSVGMSIVNLDQFFRSL